MIMMVLCVCVCVCLRENELQSVCGWNPIPDNDDEERIVER